MNTYLKNNIRIVGQLFLMLLVLGTTSATAQSAQHTVSGNVTSSEDGMPLPGVSIVLQGTTQGVSADFDGNYSINVPNGNGVLVYSYLGFETQEVAVNGRTSISIA